MNPEARPQLTCRAYQSIETAMGRTHTTEELAKDKHEWNGNKNVVKELAAERTTNTAVLSYSLSPCTVSSSNVRIEFIELDD